MGGFLLFVAGLLFFWPPDRQVRVQGAVTAVGSRVTHHYDRLWAASEKREGRLVVFGLKGLDRAAITNTLIG